MKLAVCGPGRCGKDTVSHWLKRHTHLCYQCSTSEAATTLCFVALRKKYGYETPEQAFADRVNHRKEWAEIIWAHNQPDGLTLYRDMLGETDILNGIRRGGELEALRQNSMLDLVIWIDRNVPEDESCEITVDDCDIVIPNHGTLEELYQRLTRFARVTKLSRLTPDTF
jgi:hypothetical protein